MHYVVYSVSHCYVHQSLCYRFYKLIVDKVFSSDPDDCVPLISEPVDDPMFLVCIVELLSNFQTSKRQYTACCSVDIQYSSQHSFYSIYSGAPLCALMLAITNARCVWFVVCSLLLSPTTACSCACKPCQRSECVQSGEHYYAMASQSTFASSVACCIRTSAVVQRCSERQMQYLLPKTGD
jgi:hypothetical protein